MTLSMTDFARRPALPDDAAALPPVWMQQVSLLEGRAEIATASWATLPNQPGVAILLDVHVIANERRKGRGTTLMNELVQQMHAHARLARSPLRRLMALVNQPDVIARAWLQRNGFVHVHTLSDLHPEHETMAMVRTFD